MKDIHDVITHAKFGDDRLRGSGVVAGQISAFPIDFVGRPYNTLTLPCERVIHAQLQGRRHGVDHGVDMSVMYRLQRHFECRTHALFCANIK